MPTDQFLFQAKLRSLDLIEVAVSKSYNSVSSQKMRLYENGRFVQNLRLISKSESKSTFIYAFSLESEITLGCSYELADGRNEFTPLDITVLGINPDIEETYRYDGELGAIYGKDKTVFRVFSPLAEGMAVRITDPAGTSVLRILKRQASGIYEGEAEGNLDGYGYIYLAKISGRVVEAVDPYAKSVGMNSRLGYIVDMSKLESVDLHEDALKPFSDSCKAIIYELDIRDMTSLSGAADAGTYNALARGGVKDPSGNPVGLDYISSLGVTHVQLMPFFDFQTIPDDNPRQIYNWGYDPSFFFAPEGSYSSDPSDPYVRMKELRNLIGAFHQRGIRVIMDVVFNHTFQYLTNSLNILCPNYYYRFNDDGSLSNGSGVGNDIESRRYMARKLIIDALIHFVRYYGVDGFRFDLMGIIDKTTISQAYLFLKGLKPSLMFYGEGWDMPTALPSTEKASMNNAFALRDIGFFNDRFRDILRGKVYGKGSVGPGYLTGDGDYIDGFKHVFLGSVASLAFPPLFASPNQSVNYVECHDDRTLFDNLKAEAPDDSAGTILKRIRLINACVIFAFGVPFIHSGQEAGLSKNGISNSYNAGDRVNGFDYTTAYQRKDMIDFLKDAIELKKRLPMLSLESKADIMESVSFENLPNGALLVRYGAIGDNKTEAVIIINPSQATIRYQFDKYYKILFSEAGLMRDDEYSQLVLVNALSLIVAVTER